MRKHRKIVCSSIAIQVREHFKRRLQSEGESLTAPRRGYLRRLLRRILRLGSPRRLAARVFGCPCVLVSWVWSFSIFVSSHVVVRGLEACQAGARHRYLGAWAAYYHLPLPAWRLAIFPRACTLCIHFVRSTHRVAGRSAPAQPRSHEVHTAQRG